MSEPIRLGEFVLMDPFEAWGRVAFLRGEPLSACPEYHHAAPVDRAERQCLWRRGWRHGRRHAWGRGWVIWCNLMAIEDCRNETEREGFRAAANANEMGGDRPVPGEWKDVCPYR